jgi:hypothetical protein
VPVDRSADTGAMTALPLFPLRSVLFPGGLLGLKVFEARYLDLIGQCLRQQRPFGVVALRQAVTSASTAMPTKHTNDQLAMEPPKNVQSTWLQSPPPLKIIGIARLRGKVSIIP